MKIDTNYFIILTFTQIFVIWDVFLLQFFSFSIYFGEIFLLSMFSFQLQCPAFSQIWETDWLQNIAIEMLIVSFVSFFVSFIHFLFTYFVLHRRRVWFCERFLYLSADIVCVSDLPFDGNKIFGGWSFAHLCHVCSILSNFLVFFRGLWVCVYI